MAQNYFAHLINPVSQNESKSLFDVQGITFNSIVNAKNYAAKDGISVQNMLCFTKENTCDFPSAFTAINPLDRVSCDSIQTSKKVPFFNDILNRLNDHSDAEYLIYTNLDICLMPNFYSSVKTLIDQGHDAIIINRRVISAKTFGTWKIGKNVCRPRKSSYRLRYIYF